MFYVSPFHSFYTPTNLHDNLIPDPHPMVPFPFLSLSRFLPQIEWQTKGFSMMTTIRRYTNSLYTYLCFVIRDLRWTDRTCEWYEWTNVTCVSFWRRTKRLLMTRRWLTRSPFCALSTSRQCRFTQELLITSNCRCLHAPVSQVHRRTNFIPPSLVPPIYTTYVWRGITCGWWRSANVYVLAFVLEADISSIWC